MTVRAGELAALTDALADVLAFKEPADRVLFEFFRARKSLGQRERAFITERVFAVLRRLRSLTLRAESAEPRRLAIAVVLDEPLNSLADLRPALTSEEFAWAQAFEARRTQLTAAQNAELPDWLWNELGTNLGDEDRAALAQAWLGPAPLDLRVNPLKAKREQAQRSLADAGYPSVPTPYSPLGLRIDGRPALRHLAAFTDGTLEIQDEGSQLLGYLVAPRRSDIVVDFCAGAGGKTLLLGALMRAQGRIYAFDVAPRRLANMKPRLERSGLSNVQPTLITDERDPKIAKLTGKIDRVLVDAPCSGFGTLRRNPDLKWRHVQDSIAGFAATQSAILDAAAPLLTPGGRLVYATCSVLNAENDAVVARFLASHPEFSPGNAAAELARAGIALDTGPMLRLFPHRHGCDGFFAAVLERAK